MLKGYPKGPGVALFANMGNNLMAIPGFYPIFTLIAWLIPASQSI